MSDCQICGGDAAETIKQAYQRMAELSQIITNQGIEIIEHLERIKALEAVAAWVNRHHVDKNGGTPELSNLLQAAGYNGEGYGEVVR
jgi:hypothetical protein